MEEDKFKDIFRSYDPMLTSSMAFMERLERNLNAVEMIRSENAAVMKRNRLAVIMASLAGFITGVIFTLLLPYINSLVQTLMSLILTFFQLRDNLYGIQVISWLLIGGVSVFVALNTYNISASLITYYQKDFKSRPRH